MISIQAIAVPYPTVIFHDNLQGSGKEGHSLEVAGVDLQTSCFAHGQLYVAFSRCIIIAH